MKDRLKQNEFVDLANVRSEDQQEHYLDIYNEGRNPFADKDQLIEEGNEFVDENEYWNVIRNQHYKDRRVSLVCVLKRFATSPTELTRDEMLSAFQITEEMIERFKIKGGVTMMRFGNTRLSGASVKHLHFHIVEPNPNTNIPLYTGCKTED